MLGLHYDSETARVQAATIMQTICHAAYRSSVRLAQEKGAFPSYDSKYYLRSKFITTLPDDITNGIRQYGIRNSHLLALAPTGTISLLAGNVSSGIEPVYAFRQLRKVLEADGSSKELMLENHAWRCWLKLGGDPARLPPCFVTALDLPAQAHLLMQAALQPYVDNAISKTINVPQDCNFDEFARLYSTAYALALKGCTTFRTGCRNQSVLSAASDCISCAVE
jgi:ribonucleoside-diphosphate reductase alpha chain